MKNNYVLSGAPKKNDPLPADLKYLIMIFQVVKQCEVPLEHLSAFNYIGFVGNNCSICTQFFVGTETDHPFGRIVQLPKVFSSKEECEVEIDKMKLIDIALNGKHEYLIVPFDAKIG